MAQQAVIGALRVNLSLGTVQFRKGAKKAGDVTSKLASRIKLSADAIKSAFAVAAAAAAAAFAAGVALAVRGALKDFDKLAKLSRSIGVPVEQLSALAHAADLSGVSVDEMGRAFRNVARNMQGAARAPTDFSRSLDALGVTWREANGQFVSADKLLLTVADKFKGMEDGAGKTALAMKIFGEEMGPRLVSMLNAGSGGIKEMTDEAEKLGLVISSKAAVQAERFNDNVSRLGKQMSGFGNILTAKITPALNVMIEKFIEWTGEGSAVRKLAAKIADAFNFIVAASLKVSAGFQKMGIQAAATAENISSFFTGAWTEIAERNRVAAAEIAEVNKNLALDVAAVWGETGKTIEEALGGKSGDQGGGNAPLAPPHRSWSPLRQPRKRKGFSISKSRWAKASWSR